MLFLHYWGKGRSQDLARGVRSALDAQAAVAKSVKPDHPVKPQ
jgi:hypothetical protein